MYVRMNVHKNLKAKILFLVHLSKVNIDIKIFTDCFRGLNTIEIEYNINGYSFSKDLNFVFNNLILNKYLT